MPTPRTIIFSDTPTQTASFQLAPGVFQYIESVLVEVDNTAGPDVRPSLTVSTANGVPIADKEMRRAIPAGDTGRATWALRLDDEPSEGVSAASDVSAYGGQVALSVANTGYILPWLSHGSGPAVLDISNVTYAVVVVAGVYCVTVLAGPNNAPGHTAAAGSIWTLSFSVSLPVGPPVLGPTFNTAPFGGASVDARLAPSWTGFLPIGAILELAFRHTSAGTIDVGHSTTLYRFLSE